MHDSGFVSDVTKLVGHIKPWGARLVAWAEQADSFDAFQKGILQTLYNGHDLSEEAVRLHWRCIHCALAREIPLDEYYQPTLSQDFRHQVSMRFGDGWEQILADVLTNLNLGFPFKTFFLNADAMMDRLCELDTSTRIQQGTFELTAPRIQFHAFPLSDWFPLKTYYEPREEDYTSMDALADHFTEKARLSAKLRHDKLSILESWKTKPSFRRSTYLRALYENPKRVDCYAIREAFFRAKFQKECTQFKPSLSKYIYDTYAGDGVVLDPSSGWGDRLLGALASSSVKSYHGYDPNPALTAGYQRILTKFNTTNKDVRIHCAPVENVDHGTNLYDLVFTSPPFYDVETYTDAPHQSIQGKHSLNAWMVDFLFKTLRNAWKALKPGGYLILHLNDGYGYEICEPMVLYCIAHLEHCVFQGVLGAKGSQSDAVRPLWIFQAQPPPSLMEHPAKIDAESAQRWLKYYYGGLWKRLQECVLTPLSACHRMDIEGILRNEAIMQRIGNGKPWTTFKINNLFEAISKDKPPNCGKHKHWAILLKGVGCVGFVRVRPIDYVDDGIDRITVAVHPRFQGCGIGTKAIQKLLEDYPSPLCAEVSPDNTASMHMLMNAGMASNGNISIHGKEHCSFIYK